MNNCLAKMGDTNVHSGVRNNRIIIGKIYMYIQGSIYSNGKWIDRDLGLRKKGLLAP